MAAVTNTKNDFSKGSVVKNIISLAIPMTLAQLINVLYNIVDRVYIGLIPENSTLSLTGIGLSLPIITMVIAFANLFGMGGAPLCSIERGRGNIEEAEKIMGNSFSMMVVSGILLTVFCLIFRRPMLYLFGASDVTYPYADAYITIYLLGSLFVMIGLGMNSFINSQGFGRIGMLTVLLGAVTNILLDPLFIFVFHLGVQGAALATILSQFLSALWIFRFLTGKQTILKLKLSCMRPEWSRVKAIVGLGMSGFTMSITNCTVQILCNATLHQYGGDLYVGVMTVINSVREVASLPVQGLTQSAQPVMGFNYGAKEYGRVKKAIVFMSAASIVYTTGIWSLIHGFPEFFIRIFNRDADLIAAGVPAMRLYFFGFFMMSLQFAGQATYVGLGRSKRAVFFSIFRKVIIVAPLTLLLPGVFGMGTNGVFAAEPISNFIGGLACFGTMLCTIWPEMTRLQREKEKFRILPAGEEDADALAALIDTVYRGLPEPSWFMPDGAPYIKKLMRPECGRVWKATDAATGALAGMLMLYIPGDTPENLGNDAGFTEEEKQGVIHLESVAILPQYRGFGLQYRMMGIAEEEALRAGFRHMLCTVHPENHFSRNNMVRCGFQPVVRKEKYGGLLREVMWKPLTMKK